MTDGFYRLSPRRLTQQERHAERLKILQRAIEVALGGNASQFDFVKATAPSGRSVEAKAYAAAFTRIGRPSKLKVDGKAFTGKATPEVEAAIKARATQLVNEFSEGFLAVQPLPEPKPK